MKKEEKRKNFTKELFELARKHNMPLNSAKDIEEMLKGGFKDIFEGALEAEFDEHMGYEKHEQSNNSNNRNGKSTKTIKSNLGKFKIDVPRDRDATFKPQIVAKRQNDISEIEEKVIKMYALGTSTRDITEMVKEIYGFDLNPSYISKITDKILPKIEMWKSRPLNKIYPFVFIDGIRFKTRDEGIGKEVTCYIVMGVNLNGEKEFIGYWISEAETAKYWITIFNEMKSRGVKRILIISSDNLPGISEAIKANFPKTLIQKCVIHQIRNATKFVSYKDLKAFTTDMKAIYKAVSARQAKIALEKFDQKWNEKYAYAIKSWRKNFDELITFFDLPQEIRKMVYTTNVIESVNSQIRKVTKTKGCFTSIKAIDKLIFLKIQKIEKGWTKKVVNWNIIMNQLDLLYDLDKELD